MEPLDTDPSPPAETLSPRVRANEVPVLLRPKVGARLENGIPAHIGKKRYTWTFRWRAVRGAQAYDLEYGLRGANQRPLRERVEGTSFKKVGTGLHFSRLDGYRRVRAVRDGKPLPWSEKRPFDIAYAD